MANPTGPQEGETTVPQITDSDPQPVETSVPDDQILVTQPVETATVAPRRSGGFFGIVLGGVVAAGLGFGLAQFVPEGWPLGSGAAVTPDVTALQDQIAALTTRLDAMPAEPPAVPVDVLNRLAAVEKELAVQPEAAAPADLSGVESQIDDLRKALAAVQSAPAAVSAEAEAAMQAKVASAAAEAEKARAETESLTKALAREAALADLGAAVERGAPLGDALAAIRAAGMTPPAVLVTNAAGVTPLATLQESFPEAARAALEASLRDDMGATTTDRISSFLQAQLGARSLEPREGTDADAVLSRIEGALGQGDVRRALTMLPELPAAGQEALTGWAALAQTHVAASDALAALAKAE